MINILAANLVSTNALFQTSTRPKKTKKNSNANKINGYSQPVKATSNQVKLAQKSNSQFSFKVISISNFLF